MTVPPKYGLQTWIGAAVILMGLGFVGAQLAAPKASSANGTQQIAARPAPRIIEINTKRPDISEPIAAEVKPNEPVRIEPSRLEPSRLEPNRVEPVQTPAPQFTEQGPPPVSAVELKQRAQIEAQQIAADNAAEIPQAVSEQPRRKSHSRARYPRYDRHAVY